jgi:hypothetical protein
MKTFRTRCSPWLLSCLLAFVAAFAALAGGGMVSPAQAATNLPSTTQFTCGGFRHPPSAFTGSSSGGFVGTDSFGNHCDGSFSYVLTPTSAYVTYDVERAYTVTTSPQSAALWAYIPTNHAGAPQAMYTVNLYNPGCQGTIASFTINQEQLSGWNKVGTFTIPVTPSGGCLMEVRLSSNESTSWDLAEDAVGIDTGVKDFNSANWSGYVADASKTSNKVYGVSASFNVASVCNSCTETSTWVGIGGFNNKTQLIQAGVDQKTLQAWYELIPAAPVPVGSVQDGDVVSVSIVLDTTTNKWSIIMIGPHFPTFNQKFAYSTDQSTAEWIVENPLPPLGQQQRPPSFMNPVMFSAGQWLANASKTPEPITSQAASTVWASIIKEGTAPNFICLNPANVTTANSDSDFTDFWQSPC